MIKISIIIFLNIIFLQYVLELIGEEFDKPIFVINNPSKDGCIYVVEQSNDLIIDDYKTKRFFLILKIEFINHYFQLMKEDFRFT